MYDFAIIFLDSYGEVLIDYFVNETLLQGQTKNDYLTNLRKKIWRTTRIKI